MTTLTVFGWLFDWFRRLFFRWQIHLGEAQTADLTEALELARSQGLRTLTLFASLLQQPRLREVLNNYTGNGKWGHIFDGEAVLRGAYGGPLIVYELRGRLALGERATAPATKLILHGVESGMGTAPTSSMSMKRGACSATRSRPTGYMTRSGCSASATPGSPWRRSRSRK